MATNDEIAGQLHRIATLLETTNALLRLANRQAIDRARAAIRSDKVNSAILEATSSLTPAGTVTAEVKQKTGQSPATINRRISTLIDEGVVERQGAGPATQYRATGVA